MLVYASKCSFAVNALDVYEIREFTLPERVKKNKGSYRMSSF